MIQKQPDLGMKQVWILEIFKSCGNFLKKIKITGWLDMAEKVINENK